MTVNINRFQLQIMKTFYKNLKIIFPCTLNMVSGLKRLSPSITTTGTGYYSLFRIHPVQLFIATVFDVFVSCGETVFNQL